MPYVKIKVPFYNKLQHLLHQGSTDQCFFHLHAKLGSGTIGFDYETINAIHEAIRRDTAHHSGSRVIVRYTLDPQQQGA